MTHLPEEGTLDWWLDKATEGCGGLYSKSNRIVLLAIMWIAINLVVIYLASLPDSFPLLFAIAAILTSEGIISTPLAMRSVARDLGDKIVSNIREAIKNYFPDGAVNETLNLKINFLEPGLKRKYNNFRPFIDWKKEANGRGPLSQLLNDLHDIVNGKKKKE